MQPTPTEIKDIQPLTFPGKRYTVKVYGVEEEGERIWVLQTVDHSTNQEKWTGAMGEQSDACEFAVWKSQQA